MIPGMVPPEETGTQFRMKPRYVVLLGILIVISGVILAWLGGQGILPLDPNITLTLTILTATVIMCCVSTLMIGSVASKIPDYQDMEIRFEEGMSHFENEEWENALLIFTELAGPSMDHKRALYYAAVCYGKLDDWENVKKYIRAYLKLKPKDVEAWEILVDAHKRLFEYDEAEAAQERITELSKD